MFQIIMWIMTRDTTDAGVGCQMAPTIRDSIGLKADIVYSAQVRHRHHLLETFVAYAAEFLHLVERIHPCGVKDLEVFKILSFDGSQVFFARSMTAFTGDARHQMVKLELRASDGGCRVTPETTLRAHRAHLPAQRIIERRRNCVWMQNGKIEALERLIKTDAALIKRAIMLKNISLTRDPLSEAEADGLRDSIDPIAYSVDAPLTLPHNLIRVWPIAKCQSRMRPQNLTLGNRFQRMRHRCPELTPRFEDVTLRTNAAADVADTGKIMSRTPFGYIGYRGVIRQLRLRTE